MNKYMIHGGHPLFGEVTISGAKNAAVAIIPAALLVDGTCRIENIPQISDVTLFFSILEELGRLASAQTGVPARCAVKVGKAPAAPAAAAPAQAAEHDKLDDLLAFSRQFDNIIIQE